MTNAEPLPPVHYNHDPAGDDPAFLVVVESFGFEHQEHGTPPEADLILDARRYLRDPARMHAGALLDSTGLDPAVRRATLETDGALAAIDVMIRFVVTFPRRKRRCVLAVGCVGGKHRSVVLSAEVARDLGNAGFPVTLVHRHAHLPRILREPTAAAR